MKNAYNFLPNGFVAGFFKLTRILGRPTSPILYQRRADVKNNVTKFHSYLKKCFARSLLDTSWDYFQLTLAKSTSKLWPKLHLGLDGLSNQKILKGIQYVSDRQNQFLVDISSEWYSNRCCRSFDKLVTRSVKSKQSVQLS